MFSKARGDNTHTPHHNACQVDKLIALHVRNLARPDHDLMTGIIANDTGDVLDFLNEGGAGEDDGFFNVAGIWCQAKPWRRQYA